MSPHRMAVAGRYVGATTGHKVPEACSQCVTRTGDTHHRMYARAFACPRRQTVKRRPPFGSISSKFYGEKRGDRLERCVSRREYFARVDTRWQLSGTLRQCDARILLLPFFIRQERGSRLWKLQSISRIPNIFIAVQKFTRHELCRIILCSRRVFHESWNGLIILGVYWVGIFFFFPRSLCLCAYLCTRWMLINVSGNYRHGIPFETKPRTSAQVHIKNYIPDVNVFACIWFLLMKSVTKNYKFLSHKEERYK